MYKLFRSWFFFTSLLLLLLAGAIALPQLGNTLLGDTETKLENAAQAADQQVQAVWTQLSP